MKIKQAPIWDTLDAFLDQQGPRFRTGNSAKLVREIVGAVKLAQMTEPAELRLVAEAMNADGVVAAALVRIRNAHRYDVSYGQMWREINDLIDSLEPDGEVIPELKRTAALDILDAVRKLGKESPKGGTLIEISDLAKRDKGLVLNMLKLYNSNGAIVIENDERSQTTYYRLTEAPT